MDIPIQTGWHRERFSSLIILYEKYCQGFFNDIIIIVFITNNLIKKFTKKIVKEERCIKMKDDKKEIKNPQKLGEILIHYKIITPEQLEEALKIQKSTEKRIGEILIDQAIVVQDEINWVLGKQLNLPYVQINVDNINIQLSKNISEYTLRKFKIVPIMELNDELVIAMADPTDQEAIEMIREVTKRKLKIVLASFKNIDETLDRIFKKKYNYS